MRRLVSYFLYFSNLYACFLFFVTGRLSTISVVGLSVMKEMEATVFSITTIVFLGIGILGIGVLIYNLSTNGGKRFHGSLPVKSAFGCISLLAVLVVEPGIVLYWALQSSEWLWVFIVVVRYAIYIIKIDASTHSQMNFSAVNLPKLVSDVILLLILWYIGLSNIFPLSTQTWP